MHIFFRISSILALALAFVSAHAQSTSGLKGKKLLEFGWDEPDTAFLRGHIAEMQRTPFDGCVFHVDYRRGDGTQGSFTWQCWGTNAFVEGDLAQAFLDLRNVSFGHFNQNFLRFNTTPGRLDWFDDHAAVIQNAKLAAQLARAGHCPGILFDIEQYDGPLFEYHKQRDAGIKSWELYAAQARRRGLEVMQAFQEGYPNLTVFLTFGYSLPWHQTSGGKKALADCKYGLLAPFLDGMVDGARGRARLIDGYELSYGYKTAMQFTTARQEVTRDLLPIVRDPQKYGQVFSLAFGLWLDHDWRKSGWNSDDPAKNYFSPESLTTTAREALQVAEEYVWIYSETPRWWSPEGQPVKLPAAYGDALRQAKSGARRGEGRGAGGEKHLQ
jgi:hypothetical protein